MALLRIENLTGGYGDTQILWGVDLGLREGSLTALVGANGAGKTTLLRTVMGLLRPWEGRIFLGERDITFLEPHQKAEAGLVLVPEGRQLFTSMTVYENLLLGSTPPHARDKASRRLEWIFQLFPRLKERLNQKAGTLSGGEQQMVALARGLMAEPKVLLIDELSWGLAPKLVFELFRTLQELREEGLTILLVEQNIQMALAVADYAYVMAEGRIELEGEGQQLGKDPAVRKAYLGL